MTIEQKTNLTWSQKAFVALQYFLPKVAMTNAIGWLMARETTWFKNAVIRAFVKGFSVNTKEAAAAVPDGYASMNAFFTRELAPGTRPVDAESDSIVSPCDGVISECGRIEKGQLIQAKGFSYKCGELLGDDEAASHFEGGLFMTIYLAPYDYHRVHMPIAATVTGHRHMPGALFSVNQTTAAAVPRLFARNERRVFMLTDDSHTSAMVMVGALNVGSISTVWDDTLQAGSLTQPSSLPLPRAPFAKGATLGWFNMGSTVIVLLPPAYAEWLADRRRGDVLRMGETIAKRSPE